MSRVVVTITMASLLSLSRRMFLIKFPLKPMVISVRHIKIPPKDRIRVCVRRFRRQLKDERKEKDQEIQESFLPPERKIEFDLASLASRGFLRNTKPYSPPTDVNERIQKIATSSFEFKDKQLKLTEPMTKFKFLSKCITEFNHDIPNSQLHKIKTLDDVIQYYNSPVTTTTSYDRLVTSSSKESFPQNLHVQPEPVRFHPETDKLFGGISAFPKRSTIVTGLKAKKKYQGYDARTFSEKLTQK